MIKRIRVTVSLVLTGLVLVSCAQIREVTYPKGFVYIERGSVQSTMHEFSSNLFEIGLLLDTEVVSESTANAIYEKLDNMENTANKLFADRQGSSATADIKSYETNHLVLDENLDAFLSKILLAKLQVRANPPNFYQVGKMAGECSACHIHR